VDCHGSVVKADQAAYGSLFKLGALKVPIMEQE
jgi:hypothetical protein